MRRTALATLFVLTVCLSMVARSMSHKEETVSVDCSKKGQSIQKALDAHHASGPLTIEVSGICHEDVLISRSDTTIRGSDPEQDGILGASTDTNTPNNGISVRIEAVIRDSDPGQDGIPAASSDPNTPNNGIVVRIEAVDVRLENLSITGGAADGVLVAQTGGAVIDNCRLEDNGRWGLIMTAALGTIIGTTFSDNAVGAALVSNASSASCIDCTIRGETRVNNHARMVLQRGVVDGSFNVSDYGLVRLQGVDQQSLSPLGTGFRPNSIMDMSYLESSSDLQSGARTSLKDTSLFDFSRSRLVATDAANLSCFERSDLYCDGTETKGGSTCVSCP